MKKLKYCLLPTAFALLAYSTGCNQARTFNSVDELISVEKARISSVSAEEFRGIMGRGENYKLVDCREPDEVKDGYMPGAINIPRGMIEFDITEKIPLRNTKIYIYCNNGDRSTLAATALKEMKYYDVASIAGGWEVWASKYPDKIETTAIDNNVTQKAKEGPVPVSDGGSCGG